MKNEKADSSECYCYLRNVQDLQADGKTPYDRRFGEPPKGPVIPCNEYHPISAKDQSKLHNVVRRLYLEYSSGTHCSRENLEKEISWLQTEGEKCDASEVHPRRLRDNAEKW